MRGGSKPKRDAGRLHRLVNDRQHLGGKGIEVDLVAQAGGERLDGLGRVVLAPVEAAVNRGLDATAGWLEQGGGGQGGAGHRPELGGSLPTPPNICPRTSTAPP
jgi:hypothetical protein